MKTKFLRFLNRVGYVIFFAIYISAAKPLPILLEVYFAIPAIVILVFLVSWAVDERESFILAKLEEDTDDQLLAIVKKKIIEEITDEE